MNSLFLVLAIALFIALVLKNVPIVISTIISSAFLLLTQGMSLYDGITQTYMTGFGNYVTNFFLLFMLGALFGKLVEISGAANSIANGIFKTFGDKFAILGLIITGMILTLGGVNLFVAMFTMYPLAMAMFRKADIPRKFFPPAYFVGCVGVTMTAPFTPSIQNATPIQYFATSVSAAAVPGLISSLLKLVLCTLYVMWVVKRAQNRSEHFEVLDDQATEVITNDKGPSFVISVIPMLAILIVLNIFKQPIVISLFAGIIMAFICYFRYMPRTLKAVSAEIQESVSAGLKTISITAAAAGYGAVVAATPAFQEVTDFVLNLDGNPLLIAGIATMLMAGVMNSSSGSMAITCPILGEKFLAMGVNAEALHRVMVVASSTLDSTPQSGFVCNILDYSHTTHRQGYWHVCVVSVIAPIIETLILIPLCAMFGLA